MEKVQSAINSLGSGLGTIESVGGIIQGLPDTYNDVKNTFTGIVDTVKNIPVVGGVLGGAANVAGGVLGGVAGLAGDTFGGAVDLGADALSGVGSLFGGAANTAISGLGDGLTDVTGFMGQTFDTGANLFGSLTGGLGGGSVNVADNIFDLGSSAASSTIDYGKNLFKSLW
jgi:phage-related protein